MNKPFGSKALEKLGVRSWLNADNWSTSLGGSVLDERVIAAMAEASTAFCNMQELMERASNRVAELCGVEIAHITTGSAAGLVLAATACITGKSRQKMGQLFGGLDGRESLPNEIIIQLAQSTHYDAQFYTGGARLVRVGFSDSIAKSDVESAITDRTVALVYVHSYHNAPKHLSFAAMRDIAAEAEIPIIVDCAAILPPRVNLRNFVEEGADIVVFSGGKAIRGPNNTGIMLGGGRYGREMIEAIRIQSFPGYGIGRPFKVNKESIVGLVTALEIFVADDEDAMYAAQLQVATNIESELNAIPSISARVVRNDGRDFEHPISPLVPRVYFEWDAAAVGFDAAKLDAILAAGDPPIKLRPPRLTQGSATTSNSVRLVETYFLRPGDSALVVERLRQAFSGASH